MLLMPLTSINAALRATVHHRPFRCGEMIILAQALCVKATVTMTTNVHRAYAVSSVVMAKTYPVVEAQGSGNRTTTTTATIHKRQRFRQATLERANSHLSIRLCRGTSCLIDQRKICCPQFVPVATWDVQHWTRGHATVVAVSGTVRCGRTQAS